MKKCVSYIIFTLLLAAIACACSDRFDIRQSYEFEVTYLPVPKKLRVGEVAEIRCQLLRSGYYEEAEYYLRFFQSEGAGSLRIGNNEPFLPNDTYKLPNDTFRLYYTSESEEQAVIDLIFFDSFGNKYPLSFQFNADSSKEEEL
ncbi:hypothetical protein M2451_001508 [Dysgonomonas sp. PFB1-18]|uniref:TraQ conjugal transfer family protein n=1 Tax=unclassified Dysgonomonas TaxID=2630389 RepID=UPI0024752A17|nr:MULTISPECIES: TraQ conjugal transfer family protein [unclassified Dysgonomonas]MDH6309034.1 hypothetical protein [Dysgonomonas sp. PF1-14]MDH6338785.1 hypothetical protein [Dysgonomonas sp. PF1-16]MDH6380187.1 hypothetical protein [Dysgonomonas sp. PFB1-18]MDH6397517.1 hypothetical protein [Dysgonomonas sp. PF1-23]